VRDLSTDEGRKLARISRSAKNPVRLRRAIVILMSAQGRSVRDLTSLFRVSDGHVRDVIHAFTAFSTWSLAKLRAHLVGEGIVAELSRETLRRILHAGGVSWQTTTTWKASTDPDFIPKMRRVLDLYDHPPAGGRLVCVDEFGPLNLLPRKGKAAACG
jgi:transposase